MIGITVSVTRGAPRFNATATPPITAVIGSHVLAPGAIPGARSTDRGAAKLGASQDLAGNFA